ncbi:MAG: THUMP domain-containing protein [Myxococcota bacterium]
MRAGYERVQPGVAGASFLASREALERACLVLRTAHRVLWTVGDVDAGDGDRLYRGVAALARWSELVPPDKTFAVHATARDNPAFRDARFAGLRTKDAIVDHVRDELGLRPSVDVADPDVQVRIAISGRRGVLSLDLAGRDSLHARGYRTQAGAAPLRESLAAGLLAIAEHRPDEPLLDPCCGSGTILIEAALAARAIAPGLAGHRGYGFERWPGFEPERLAKSIAGLERAIRPPLPTRLVGTDLDGQVLTMARENAERAGVSDDIRLLRNDAGSWSPPLELSRAGPGLIATNPPWGERLGDRQAADRLLERMAQRWREVLPGWRAAVLVGDRQQASLLRLADPRLVPLRHGALDVTLVLGRVPGPS